MTPTQTLVIPIDMKVSTNEIYAGKHWTHRNKIKNFYRLICKQAIRSQGIKPMTSFPVRVSFSFVFKSRLFDCSNCSFLAKVIEDSIVKEGLLPDDSPKYIRPMILDSEKGKKDMVIVEFWEFKKEITNEI